MIDELKRTAINEPHKFSPSAKEAVDGIQAERIVKLVEPDFEGLPEFIDEQGINYTSFFSRIVTAFPIDADRMDYLWRDSYFSGVTYGIYDINRILSSILTTIQGNEVHLTYKESGIDSMLRFIQCRTHLYNQVYFHKTNRAANTMLEFATATKREQKVKLMDTYQSFKELTNFYITNSDDLFLTATVGSKLIDTKSQKEVLQELLDRKLFKRVYESKIVLHPPTKEGKEAVKRIKEEIDKKLSTINTAEIVATTDLYENLTFKDADKKTILIARKTEIKYQFLQDWTHFNKEFELANMNAIMLRVYIQRTFHNSEEFKSIKEIIINLIRTEIDELEQLSNHREDSSTS